MLGQLDGQPVCGARPAWSWHPGEILVDAYRIPVREDADLGPVPLYLGMYDGLTGERLPVLAADGQLLDDRIYLADVVIRAP